MSYDSCFLYYYVLQRPILRESWNETVTWRHSARCTQLGLTDDVFFEDVWPIQGGDEHGAQHDAEALTAAREVCDACPVRRRCFAKAMAEERGVGAAFRFGVFAGTTPLQRWSIEHRGSQNCPLCGTVLDPNSLRAGEIVCPEECAIDRTVPPIPDGGDRWTRRHTTLARKVIRWLVEEVVVGGAVPRPTNLAEQWGERRTDMTRVYEALVTDGTLGFTDSGYIRKAARVGAVRAPRLLYAAAPPVTLGPAWEPPHTRTSAAPVTFTASPIKLLG